MHSHHSHSIKTKIIHWAGIIFGGISLSFLFLGLFNILTVKNVVVEGASELIGSDFVHGSVLFLTDERMLKKYLYKKNPTFASVEIQKQYPNTLKITVTETPYKAVLKVQGGYFLLNNEGRIIKKSKTLDGYTGLIPLTFYQPIDFGSYAIGETLGFQEISYALYFLQTLQAVGVTIDTVAIDNFYMIVLNNTDQKYIFTAEKEKQEQGGQIGEVIRQLHASGKSYTSIDVRFNKPIVILKKDQQV